MSSNYPPGSMMGSGIYAEEISITFVCASCGEDNTDVTAITDDWKFHALAECEHCGAEHDHDLLPEEPEDY